MAVQFLTLSVHSYSIISLFGKHNRTISPCSLKEIFNAFEKYIFPLEPLVIYWNKRKVRLNLETLPIEFSL